MEEQKKILSMFKEGKISDDEAISLMEALTKSTRKSSLTGKLCIEVQSHDDDQVMVKIPLKLAPLALKMVPKGTQDQIKNQHGIDISDLLSNLDAIASELDEDLVNVSSHDGDKVRIYIKR